MFTDVKRTPKLVLAGVQVRWRQAGEVQASRCSGNLDVSEIWMPRPTPGPGLYRISINLSGGGKNIYIGEGANITRRLGDYKRTYNEDGQNRTEARMSRRMRKALAEGLAVVVDVATTGKINLTGQERPLQMDKTAERRFAEVAAALAESEQDVRGMVVILNRDLDEDWCLED